MYVLSNLSLLYDGTGEQPSTVHRNVDVEVRTGRVTAVRPHDPAPGGDLLRVDAGGLTATPGLVDAHGHVTVHGLGTADLARMRDAAWPLWAEKALYLSLVEGGVTTMRDVGGAPHFLKALVDDGILIGPRLKVAIVMLSTTGGHADFLGPDRCPGADPSLWPVGPGRPSSIVDGPWECRRRVRELRACGADLVKICASPGVASPGDHLEHRDFTAEEIAAITDEAGGRGMPVAAHAHSESGIELAIRHGVHDIQHASCLTPELAELAAERGCVVTATSWIVAALLEQEDLTPFVREKAARIGERHVAAVGHARAAGLPILMGTDPVLPGMHGRNWMEIVHLVRDGLPPLAAWHAATGQGAREVGQPDAGTVVTGQRADLLLWRQDVVHEPGRLGTGVLAEVIKDGVAYRGGLKGLPARSFRDTALETWPDLERPPGRPA